MTPHLPRRLSSQILITQLLILAGTVGAGFALFMAQQRRELQRQYEHRALAIAQTIAGIPEVQDCLSANQPAKTRSGADCDTAIQRITSRIQKATAASYVVVVDTRGTIHAGPDPALIGKQIDEPVVTADGKTHSGVDDLGGSPSAGGKAPVQVDGTIVGEVSAGIQERAVSNAFGRELPIFATWSVLALVAGAAASVLLARRIKRRTFDLELDEIAALLLQREATLHSIREGVIAFDEREQATVVNDEARRLLDLGDGKLAGKLTEALAPGRLRDLLTGKINEPDALVLTDSRCLVINRLPIKLNGKEHGAVATIRDQTSQADLLRELDSARGMAGSLRAQHHEFANRTQTVIGMLEREGVPERARIEHALDYLTDAPSDRSDFATMVEARIGPPPVAGLLIGKAAVAGERHLRLVLTSDSHLTDGFGLIDALITVAGNLIDNALDALSGMMEGAEPVTDGEIAVSLTESADEVAIEVLDNGPGVPPGAAEQIFTDGFTTKTKDVDRGAGDALRRGVGLALVRQLVRRLGGEITVTEGPGARFTARLPKQAPAGQEAAGQARGGHEVAASGATTAERPQ